MEKRFAAQRADQRHEIVIGRFAARDPNPAITGVLRRHLIRARRDLIFGGEFPALVIGVALRTAHGTAGQPDKAHLETTQMAFALDGPENGITR